MKIDETVIVKIDLEIEELKILVDDLERIAILDAEELHEFDFLCSFYKQLKEILKNYE
jgi:hypothetical protein